MRCIERLGDDNPILGARLEFAPRNQMLRIWFDGFIADVALPDDLGWAGIFWKGWGWGLPSRRDPGPVAQRRQRHRELLADFSKGYVRYFVLFRDGGDGFCPDFLVEFGPLIAHGDGWHDQDREPASSRVSY